MREFRGWEGERVCIVVWEAHLPPVTCHLCAQTFLPLSGRVISCRRRKPPMKAARSDWYCSYISVQYYSLQCMFCTASRQRGSILPWFPAVLCAIVQSGGCEAGVVYSVQMYSELTTFTVQRPALQHSTGKSGDQATTTRTKYDLSTQDIFHLVSTFPGRRCDRRGWPSTDQYLPGNFKPYLRHFGHWTASVTS